MPTRDLFEAVGALTHPLPTIEAFAESNPHLSTFDVQMIHADEVERVLRERAEYVENLRLQAEHDEHHFDPLLREIAHARRAMLNAEHQMRLLIAYGREFVRPQPHQLKEIAAASGLSISGVRIAYDEDEISEVIASTDHGPLSRLHLARCG